MKGAIMYSTKYGSTAQYANWIGEATGLPVLNVKDRNADPSQYDFLVLGSPIIYYKLIIRKWIKANWRIIKDKPIIFFSVSGAGAGKKLDEWINACLPEELIARMEHIALRGRHIKGELTWFDRVMLFVAGLKNPDPVARRDELRGFDYMDKSSIAPIVKLVADFSNSTVETTGVPEATATDIS